MVVGSLVILKSLFQVPLSLKSLSFSLMVYRGTQQTVSVNICSEDLLSPTIFGLKCGEKLEFSLAQIFVKGESNACSFRRNKNVVLSFYEKRSANIFGKTTAARKFG